MPNVMTIESNMPAQTLESMVVACINGSATIKDLRHWIKLNRPDLAEHLYADNVTSLTTFRASKQYKNAPEDATHWTVKGCLEDTLNKMGDTWPVDNAVIVLELDGEYVFRYAGTHMNRGKAIELAAVLFSDTTSLANDL